MKSTYLIVLAAVLGTLTSAVSCGPAEKLARPTDAGKEKPVSALAAMFDTSAVFSSNLTGFALYDPADDSMLYAQNEFRYFTPASNTKLFTFYAGLKLLPDTLPALEYTVRGDSLIFWGTGDPSFLHHDFGVDSVYRFLKNRPENLYYSDAHFKDELLGPGWAWSDYNYYYSPEKSPFPIYGNVARFTMEQIELRRVKPTGRGLAVSPPLLRSHIEASVSKDEDLPILLRGIADNRFEYKPRADTLTYTVDKPFHYTPELITKLLSDTLGRPVQYLEMEKPDSVRRLYSIPADTAYKRMLQPSDNFIAEQLLLQIASELGMPLNSRKVIGYVTETYLQDLPDEPQWADGSGLSRYNMFTPRSIIRLLEKIDAEFFYDNEMYQLFPAGGESGTIRNWYGSRDGGPPYIFAKTGTLRNNHSLSGFVITENGKKLIFSFMNNHYITPSSVVKEEMEKVLWYIYKRY